MGKGGRVYSELDLAGWKGLVLHHHGAAASQDQDIQLLLLLMRLLVPLTSNLRVMSGDQSHLSGRKQARGETVKERQMKGKGHLMVSYMNLLPQEGPCPFVNRGCPTVTSDRALTRLLPSCLLVLT